MENEKRIKNYVLYSFWATIVLWILSMIVITESPEATTVEVVFALIWIATTIFCFVNSIRALTISKIKKGFIITALVISSILMLLFFCGFLIGIIGTI